DGCVCAKVLGAERGVEVKACRAQDYAYTPPAGRYFQLHRGHLMWVRPEEERFVTPELIRMATFAATAPELRARIRALGAAGYQQLAVQVVPGQEDALEDWAELAATL